MLFDIYYVRSIVLGDEDGSLDLEGVYKVDKGRKDYRQRKQYICEGKETQEYEMFGYW